MSVSARRETAPMPIRSPPALEEELGGYREFGAATRRSSTSVELGDGGRLEVPTFVNEFWTARQRAARRLHEISYRACFKPQLPRFFIERLTRPDDVVYDPFMGRGTTVLEAALLGRAPWGCDANPLACALVAPRLAPPRLEEVAERLASIDLDWAGPLPDDLLVFYHPGTLGALLALRRYLLERERAGTFDGVDGWIRLVAINRLTGHSPGFLSVYTLPPNQATSVVAQRRINARRGQAPPPRDVVAVLLRKTRSLLSDLTERDREALAAARARARLLSGSSESTPDLPSGGVDLVVTSPPFLNVVDYAGDNWLRAWFGGVDLAAAPLTVPARLDVWAAAMQRTLRELARLLAPGGHVAFEVGEVRRGRLKLEETIVRAGVAAGLEPRLLVIHDQGFTKTSHCWGVENRRLGTNTHRIVLFRARR